MISVAVQWNPKQAMLKSIIQKPDKFDEAIKLVLELHSMVHESEMCDIEIKTFEDELWDGLDEKAFRTMLNDKDVTIAWNIWHITRIEDITANVLIANDTQIIDCNNWTQKMNVKVRDTGNAMNNEETIAFSSEIDMRELRNYRLAVGRKTREILGNLKPEDLKKKIESNRLQRVLNDGSVLDVEGSKWLIDFWGRKNAAGILLMPITRHQVVHINDSLKIKETYMKKSKPY